MTKAWVKTSGTSTTNGASVLFLGFHWSFTIMEPSGKGWPLPGTPALYALIIAGLATITLSTSSVRAEDAAAQSSYPLKSENAIPPGDISEYLSLLLSWAFDEEGDHCDGCRNNGKAGDTFRGGACFYLLFLLFLHHRFRHKFRHGVFSLRKKFF